MAHMGRYCKAYSVRRFREYTKWNEDVSQLKPLESSDSEPQAERGLTDEDYLLLQENYSVTNGIFLDEGIVFNDVTPEWREFCQKTLQFQIPEWIEQEHPSVSVEKQEAD